MVINLKRIVYVPKDANGNPLKDADGNDIKREVATMDDGLNLLVMMANKC